MKASPCRIHSACTVEGTKYHDPGNHEPTGHSRRVTRDRGDLLLKERRGLLADTLADGLQSIFGRCPAAPAARALAGADRGEPAREPDSDRARPRGPQRRGNDRAARAHAQGPRRQPREATERQHHLRLAFRCYQDAYERTAGYWAGINAATMALLRRRARPGDRRLRRSFARCSASSSGGPTTIARRSLLDIGDAWRGGAAPA